MSDQRRKRRRSNSLDPKNSSNVNRHWVTRDERRHRREVSRPELENGAASNRFHHSDTNSLWQASPNSDVQAFSRHPRNEEFSVGPHPSGLQVNTREGSWRSGPELHFPQCWDTPGVETQKVVVLPADSWPLESMFFWSENIDDINTERTTGDDFNNASEVDSVCDAGSPGLSGVMESWDYEHLPPNILLKIFSQLQVQSLASAGLVCRAWHQIAMDDLLWRHLCLRDWILPSRHSTSTPTPKRALPEGSSWYWEYKRLHYHTPRVLSQVITEHRDQVLHVSFSHDGQLFATSSKDGTIKVWRTTQPAVLKYDYNMAEFHWKYTQFSQFNESDTLLLVSGVHIGTMSTSGEIAVFSLVNGFELQCRVLNKPYDVFGTWYNDTHLLSGNLHWVGHLNSCSALWLNKASQAIETEQESVVMRLYRFYNDNASSIRTIMIAKCLTNDTETPNGEEGSDQEKPRQDHPKAMDVEASTAGSEMHHKAAGCSEGGEGIDRLLGGGLPSGVGAGADNSCKPGPVPESGLPLGGQPVVEEMYPDKYLIFTMGKETYTPHMIGIKRIKSLELQAAHREGLRQPRRLRRQSVGGPPLLPDVEDNNHGMDRNRYDEVDFSFDLKGHIIGMALSPDHRHLFVNSRPWPKDAVVENPIQPPPIAQEIDLHVFDLVQMQEVGGLFRSHRAYTPNDECFFIFLDVCNEYVASGAEDHFGHMWDRHYGICVNKFPHDDVVNCVGFNPKDSEMLVTVSDDKNIKIWLSRNRMEKVPRPQPEAARKSLRSLAPPPPVSI